MTVLFCVINVCKYVVIEKKANIGTCVGKLKIPKHPRFTLVLSWVAETIFVSLLIPSCAATLQWVWRKWSEVLPFKKRVVGWVSLSSENQFVFLVKIFWDYKIVHDYLSRYLVLWLCGKNLKTNSPKRSTSNCKNQCR